MNDKCTICGGDTHKPLHRLEDDLVLCSRHLYIVARYWGGLGDRKRKKILVTNFVKESDYKKYRRG